MLFRQYHLRFIRNTVNESVPKEWSNTKGRFVLLSRLVTMLWQSRSTVVKNHFYKLYVQAKDELLLINPEYKFPKRGGLRQMS